MCPKGFVITEIAAELLLYNTGNVNNNNNDDDDVDVDATANKDTKTGEDAATEEVPSQFQNQEKEEDNYEEKHDNNVDDYNNIFNEWYFNGDNSNNLDNENIDYPSAYVDADPSPPPETSLKRYNLPFLLSFDVSLYSGQSYKHFTSVNYDSRVVIWGIFK